MPPTIRLRHLRTSTSTSIVYDQEQIREANPQRGDMEMLNGIVYADAGAGADHRLQGRAGG